MCLISPLTQLDARAKFEEAVGRFTSNVETVRDSKPLFHLFYRYEANYGDLSQISKLEKRMAKLFPGDPHLTTFAMRYQILGSEEFDPTRAQLLISMPAQARPKAMASIERDGMAPPSRDSPAPAGGMFSPRLAAASPRLGMLAGPPAAGRYSPKRPFPGAHDAGESPPRKLARGESPLKGAAGRRLDAAKRRAAAAGAPPLAAQAGAGGAQAAAAGGGDGDAAAAGAGAAPRHQRAAGHAPAARRGGRVAGPRRGGDAAHAAAGAAAGPGGGDAAREERPGPRGGRGVRRAAARRRSGVRSAAALRVRAAVRRGRAWDGGLGGVCGCTEAGRVVVAALGPGWDAGFVDGMRCAWCYGHGHGRGIRVRRMRCVHWLPGGSPGCTVIRRLGITLLCRNFFW